MTTIWRCSPAGTAGAATRISASSPGSHGRTRSCAARTSRGSSGLSATRKPIGWVLGRLEAGQEIERAELEPAELEREGARVILRVDRYVEEPVTAVEVVPEEGQLVLFEEGDKGALPALVPPLQPLSEVPPPPLHRVRRLSFSALALFERCSYRYYAERVAGMRPADERRAAPGT